MSSVRKHYSTDLKVKIVLEILKEEKSVTQLASDHKIHYSQPLKWKKQAMEGLPELFVNSNQKVDHFGNLLKVVRFPLLLAPVSTVLR
jgi:transposase-like protein